MLESFVGGGPMPPEKSMMTRFRGLMASLFGLLPIRKVGNVPAFVTKVLFSGSSVSTSLNAATNEVYFWNDNGTFTVEGSTSSLFMVRGSNGAVSGLINNSGGCCTTTGFGSGSNANPDVGFVRAAAGVWQIGAGITTSSYGSLILGNTDALTTTVATALEVHHKSSGTPAAGFGSALVWYLDSSTTANRPAAEEQVTWSTATDGSRAGRLTLGVHDSATSAGSPRNALQIDTSGSAVTITALGNILAPSDGAIYVGGSAAGGRPYGTFYGISADGNVTAGMIRWNDSSTTGTRIEAGKLIVGSGSAIGFSSAAPSSAAADVAFRRNAAGVVEVNNGTSGQWAALKLGARDAVTAAVTTCLTVGHQSTGTPAAGFGSSLLFNLDSSTTADRPAAEQQVKWATATDGSRKGQLVLGVHDASTSAGTPRVGIQIDTNGTNAYALINSWYGGITDDGNSGTGTITFDMSATNQHKLTLTGNCTLAVSNVQVGQRFTLFLKQDGTGSRTVTWFSGITWQGSATPPTLTTTLNKVDIISFICYAANSYYGTSALNF